MKDRDNKTWLKALPGLVFLFLLLVGNTAMAGGLFVPIHGVAAMGRAGAVVVSSRDPQALVYNPALLALTEGHQLLVDVSWAMLNMEFQRSPSTARNGDVVTYDPVNNIAPGITIPQVLFSTDFGTDQFALGVGVFTPYAPPARYPENGAQRYAVIDMSNTIVMTQEIAFAWRPHPRFSIGLGLQNVTAILDGVGICSTYLGIYGSPEDPEYDSLIYVHASDLFTFSMNAGIWAEPVDGFELALAFQLFSDHESKDGEYKAALPPHYTYEPSSLTGDGMDMTMSLPWSLRLGLRYHQENVFDIELDMWIERWSRHETINLISHNVWVLNPPLVQDVKIDGFVLERRMKDTFGLSLGADWNALPFMTVRAGFLYESGAANDELYSVFLYDNHKFGGSIGASFNVAKWCRLDVSYMHVHQLPKTVTEGTFQQYNLVYPEAGTVTNNGDYKSYFDFIGLGADFMF